MVPRVGFVTTKIDRPVDMDGQIGVDLNQAVAVSLVPVVTTPRFVGDILETEALALRQRKMGCAAFATLDDGGIENRLEPIRGDDELLTKRLDTIGQGLVARNKLVDLIQNPPEVLVVPLWRDGAVEHLCLFVERVLPALQHRRLGGDGGELGSEIAAAQAG